MSDVLSDSRIDTQYRVETPEGIDLEAQLAGPFPRMLAYGIDLFIRSLVIMAVAIALGVLGKAATGFILILAFLLEWFYPVLFDIYRAGQTPGKQILGIAVINDDLTPIGWNASLVRNILRAADFLPSLYLGGLLCMVLDKRFRRLGDLAAGTLVVHRQEQSEALTLPAAVARPPAIPLELEDQLAIISFTQRHQQLSQDRQRELANILEAITGQRDEEAVNSLRGMGVWLLGDRP